METNRVTPEWGSNPFRSDSTFSANVGFNDHALLPFSKERHFADLRYFFYRFYMNVPENENAAYLVKNIKNKGPFYA